MLKLCVLVSGGGTNLQAIIDNIANGIIPDTEIVGVLSNNRKAFALERAKNHGIPAVCVSPKDYPTRDLFYQAFMETVDRIDPDLIEFARIGLGVGSVIKEFVKEDLDSGRLVQH